MGACQSVGGAATSGKGFKGDQITSAIVAALLDADHTEIENRRQRRHQQQYQQRQPFRHRDMAGGADGGNTPSAMAFRNGVEGVGNVPAPLPTELLKDKDYAKEFTTHCPYVSDERNTVTTIEVTEYAPDAFFLLRELGGTNDEVFIDEWDTFPKATRTVMNAKRGGDPRRNAAGRGADADDDAGGGLELGEGRSMALFLKSKSMAFMCKTISETEVQVLVDILPQYLRHIETNPDSMLMRFVMLLKVTVNTATYSSDANTPRGSGRRGGGAPAVPLTEKDFAGQKPESRESEIGYVLVFNDCFSNCDVLHERWDLKGRHPKPGKFRHFSTHQLYRNRVVQPKVKQRAAEQNSVFDNINYEENRGRGGQRANRGGGRYGNDLDEDEQRQAADLSSDEEGAESPNLRADTTLDKMRLNTRKDKDLARLFWLEPADRQYLIQQMTSDFKFLLDCGLMDYSILIGVRYNTPEEQYEKEQRKNTSMAAAAAAGSNFRSIGPSTPPGSPTAALHNGAMPSRSSLHAMKMPFVMGEENNAGIIEVRPASPNAGHPHGGGGGSGGHGGAPEAEPEFDEFSSQFHQGVDSIECVETYYIGIIDMLTVYNGKKKIANFCKKCLWQEVTLSTIPPHKYAERIEKYAHRIFPRVAIAECNDGTLLPQKQCLLIGRGKVSTHAAGFKVAKDYMQSKNQQEFLVAPAHPQE